MDNNNINSVSDEQLKDLLRTLMFQHYDGQSFQVKNLQEIFKSSLDDKHIDKPKPPKFYRLFYSIKDELAEDGMIKKIKHGIFFLASEGVDDYSEDDSETFEDDLEVEENYETETQVIGEGESEVYCYYFEAYAELARLKGESRFRCKIGKTQDTNKRFASSKTDLPEQRKVGLIIRTDHPDEVEAILHNSLRISGKQASAPGREWFITTPDEVAELYYAISTCINQKIA